ncbi:MAG TPA: helix-turn-helix domain-containing protein [Caulobacteraceae bacterium]|jgi:DNA-binding transcriptional MerR regulator
MAEPRRFTAEQLAFHTGVPLRTVRFYVQEKLIEPPLGRGRGAHFTDDHVVQLQQARTLQNAGFSLQAIREQRHDLTVGLQAMARYNTWWAAWKTRELDESQRREVVEPDEDQDEFDASNALRIPMADGVDLLIDQNRRLPSPKALVDLALHVRRLFDGL